MCSGVRTISTSKAREGEGYIGFGLEGVKSQETLKPRPSTLNP